MLTMMVGDRMVVGCRWCTDETHYQLDGSVNTQTCQFSCTENPQVCRTQRLHFSKVTIFTAESRKDIIGLLFLQKTVTTERYLRFWNDLFTQYNCWWVVVHAIFSRPTRTPELWVWIEEYFGNMQSGCFSLFHIYNRQGLAFILTRLCSLGLHFWGAHWSTLFIW